MSRVAVVVPEGDLARAVVVRRGPFGARCVEVAAGAADEIAGRLAGRVDEVRVAAPAPVARRLVEMPGRSTDDAVAYEVEPDLPWSIEEAAVGAVRLGRGRFAVSAALRDGVDRALAPYRDLGGRVSAIDLVAAAAAGAARMTRARRAAVRFDSHVALVERGVATAIRPVDGLPDDAAFAALAASAGAEAPPDRRVVVGEGEGSLDARARLGAPADAPPAALLAAVAPAGTFPVLAEAARVRRRDLTLVLAVAAAVIALAAAGLDAAAAVRRRDALRAETLALYREALPRGRGAAPKVEIERVVASLQARRDLLESIAAKRASAARSLAALSGALPAGGRVRLVEFRADAERVALVAEAASADDVASIAAAAEVAGLGDVQTPEVRPAPGGGGTRFVLEARP